MALPSLAPQPLVRIPQPFDDPAWIFGLKYDGFRALAFIEEGQARLVSRNGHTFCQFAPLAQAITRQLANGIYDGEVCVLDAEGRSQFNALLFRRGSPVFAAFDVHVLWAEGDDVRHLALLERKRRLATVMPKRPQALLLVQHIEGHRAVEVRSRDHGKHRVFFYECSAHRRKGGTVCANDLPARMDDTNDPSSKSCGLHFSMFASSKQRSAHARRR